MTPAHALTPSSGAPALVRGAVAPVRTAGGQPFASLVETISADQGFGGNATPTGQAQVGGPASEIEPPVPSPSGSPSDHVSAPSTAPVVALPSVPSLPGLTIAMPGHSLNRHPATSVGAEAAAEPRELSETGGGIEIDPSESPVAMAATDARMLVPDAALQDATLRPDAQAAIASLLPAGRSGEAGIAPRPETMAGEPGSAAERTAAGLSDPKSAAAVPADAGVRPMQITTATMGGASTQSHEQWHGKADDRWVADLARAVSQASGGDGAELAFRSSNLGLVQFGLERSADSFVLTLNPSSDDAAAMMIAAQDRLIREAMAQNLRLSVVQAGTEQAPGSGFASAGNGHGSGGPDSHAARHNSPSSAQVPPDRSEVQQMVDHDSAKVRHRFA